MAFNPYPIYGRIKKAGVGQVGKTVKVTNKSLPEPFESKEVTTITNGEYLVDLANLPSGYIDTDVVEIRCDELGIVVETKVDVVNYLGGREVSFDSKKLSCQLDVKGPAVVTLPSSFQTGVVGVAKLPSQLIIQTTAVKKLSSEVVIGKENIVKLSSTFLLRKMGTLAFPSTLYVGLKTGTQTFNSQLTVRGQKKKNLPSKLICQEIISKRWSVWISD